MRRRAIPRSPFACRHLQTGRPLEAVITVPAHFQYSQRSATKEAYRLAGITVIDTINEPTAAALAECHRMAIVRPVTALVFDLGGGTLDVTIVDMHRQGVQCRAIDGDMHLGGVNYDSVLEQYLKQVRSMRSNF